VINILSSIQIYCIGNDLVINCSTRESVVRSSAAQTVDGKIRGRTPGFLSRAFLYWCNSEGSPPQMSQGPVWYRTWASRWEVCDQPLEPRYFPQIPCYSPRPFAQSGLWHNIREALLFGRVPDQHAWGQII